MWLSGRSSTRVVVWVPHTPLLRVQVGLALDLQCVLLSDIFTQVNNVLIINTYFIIHHVFDFTNMGENEQVDTSGV